MPIAAISALKPMSTVKIATVTFSISSMPA